MTIDRNNLPLDLFAHYSDPRFSRGQTATVYGIPSGPRGHPGLHYDYSDRLWQGDYIKAQEASWIATELGAVQNSPRWLTLFLSHFYGRRVELVHVLKGVNVSNGYHYNVYGTKDGNSVISFPNTRGEFIDRELDYLAQSAPLTANLHRAERNADAAERAGVCWGAPCMTPADIAAVISDLADLWRGTRESAAIRSAAGYFLKALQQQGADLFDPDAFWRACRIDLPEETCAPTEHR